MKLDFCCPTLFGLEGIVADELRFEGKLEDVRAENGRVLFTGDFQTLAWANLNLRCAERVLVRLGTFRAKTFDQLFEGVRAIRWEDWIPADGAFPVKGHALNSALHSIPDCQKIIKARYPLGGLDSGRWCISGQGARAELGAAFDSGLSEDHQESSCQPLRAGIRRKLV